MYFSELLTAALQVILGKQGKVPPVCIAAVSSVKMGPYCKINSNARFLACSVQNHKKFN